MIKSRGDIVQFVEHLPDLSLASLELAPVIQDVNSGSLEIKEEEPGGQGHSYLYSEFKASPYI